MSLNLNRILNTMAGSAMAIAVAAGQGRTVQRGDGIGQARREPDEVFASRGGHVRQI